MNATNTPSPRAVPLPYSRLILNVVGLGVCGWMLLDSHAALAALLG